METEFLIRDDTLCSVREWVQTFCSSLNTAAQNGIGMIDLFLADSTFTGVFADSVREYLSEVHREILRGFAEVTCMLQEKVQAYLDGYALIDGQTGFVLPDSTMETFKEGLLKLLQALGNCTANIQSAAGMISDLLDIPGFSLDGVEDLTQQTCGTVSNLQEEIHSYETFYSSGIAEVQRAVLDLEQVVSCLGSDGWTDIETYKSGAFSVVLESCSLAELLVLADLREQGFEDSMISRMELYGYDPLDLRQLCSACATDADREFLFGLAGGDFEKAFSGDPLALSDPMSIMAADYALRLYTCGDRDQLEAFNNAILLQTDGAGWFSEPGPGVRTNSQVYLEYLFDGSMALLELNSSMLLQENVTQEMKERNWDLLAMAGLWSTQYYLSEDLLYRKDPDYPARVFLETSGGDASGISFTYTYTAISHNPFKSRGDVISVDVSSEILVTSEDLLNGMYLAERGKLEEASDRLLLQTLGESAWSAGVTVASVAVPELGLALKMLETAVTEDTSGMDDDLLHLTGKLQDGGGGTGNILLGEAIDGLQSYMDKNTELSDKIAHLDRLYEGSMWGTGIRTDYTIPDAFSSGSRTHILSGIYNPDYLETLGEWNREGIHALLPDADLVQIGWVIDQHPEYSGISPDQLAYKMIYGFGTDSILDYPVSEIAEAKKIVESIIREVYNGGEYGLQWNVEDAF